MIAIIHYGAGNVASVQNALQSLKLPSKIVKNSEELADAKYVIFPGQGRMGLACQNLNQSKMAQAIQNLTIPFLGICLGMQILLESSQEDDAQGLGLIKGKSKQFSSNLRIPHIGWNRVYSHQKSPLFERINAGEYFYFAHSYCVKESSASLATTYYGQKIISAVQHQNFYAVQFHPEKSGEAGLQLLRNFFSNLTMFIFPAIDLIDGHCVRLTQGDYEQSKTYHLNPVDVAKQFEREGASWIHVVDLDGAKAGQPVNTQIALQIVKETKLFVQLGGGIRDFLTASQFLKAGIHRIILGTAAIENPNLAQQLIDEFGNHRVSISLDMKSGYVAVRGWKDSSPLQFSHALELMKKASVQTLVITDIAKDGMLQGVNTKLIEQAQGFDVIASGGVTSYEDLKALQKINAHGAIIGKALYENYINLNQALEIGGMENLAKRIIPCLDVKDGLVVKGTNFKELKQVGDAVELGLQYSKQGADELVFLDVSATAEGRKNMSYLASQVAKQVQIPFTIGGGISQLEDVQLLFESGADKVSLGSAAITQPKLVEQIANAFGSQSLVISLDAKRYENSWKLYIKGGREETETDAIEFAKKMESLGAGELLVNSLDCDGMQSGFDLDLLNAVADVVNIPVIASSGAGELEHFLQVFQKTPVTAALASGIFHYGKFSISEVKQFLHTQQIRIRSVNNPNSSLPI